MGEEIGRGAAAIPGSRVEISGDRKKAFGPEEPPIGDFGQPTGAKHLRKLSAHFFERPGMIDRHIALAAAGFVIAGEHADPLEQSGFSGAVFTDDDGDRPIETQLELVQQEWQTKRIGCAVGDARRLKPNAPEIRRRQPNVALSFRTHAPAPRRLAKTRDLASRHQNITGTLSEGKWGPWPHGVPRDWSSQMRLPRMDARRYTNR